MGIKKHFISRSLTGAETSDGQETTTWKMPGDILVSLVMDDVHLGRETHLIAGENTGLSEDEKSIVALTAGYPKITENKGEKSDTVHVSLVPIISVCDDHWSVNMTVYPPVDEDLALTTQHILDLLQHERVNYGIRTKKIEKLLQKAKEEDCFLRDEIIAKGRLPVHGEDAKLRMNMDLEAQAGKELKGGQMDYRERNLFVGVEKEQVIATKVDATTGIPGKDVFGNEVPQTPGKDQLLNFGSELIYDEATRELSAAVSGVISVTNNQRVQISQKKTISSDIDFTTGNIKSKGCVEIRGDVKPAFKVVASGDILVQGNVESATLETEANAILNSGLIGRKSIIKAKGNVDLAYIENGRIEAGGSIHIKKEVYFSELHSGADIIVAGNWPVLGSKLIAGGSITLHDVDTDNSPLSSLIAGVDFKRYEQFGEITAQVQQLKERLRLLTLRGADQAKDPFLSTAEECKRLEEKLNRFNMTPVGCSDSRMSGIRHAMNQKITVGGKILPGAFVRIGCKEAQLKKTLQNGEFSLNTETGELIFASLQSSLTIVLAQE